MRYGLTTMSSLGGTVVVVVELETDAEIDATGGRSELGDAGLA
jgi:hypothetical protein